MHSSAQTLNEYIEELPADRAGEIKKVRQVILDNLPEGYEEGMLYGMIAYFVPLKEYPETYNGQPLGYVALANQKNYMSLYLMGVYSSKSESNRFINEYKKTGKKLDMGKSCVRFKKADELPLDLIAQAVRKYTPAQYIKLYERNRKK